MDLDKIEDKEKLYRVVRKSNPDEFISGKPVAALFMDKMGSGECRGVGTYPNPIGNRKNIYHAEIWESEDKKVISLFKAIQLAKLCQEIQN